MVLHKLPASTVAEVTDGTEPRDPARESSGSEEDNDDDENWDDWDSDAHEKVPTRSLFDDTVFPSAKAALEHDKKKYGFDLDEISRKLTLDFHGRVRLINYIRKEKPPTQTVAAFTGKEALFSSDDYLVPVVENDPLLQFGSDTWSDEDSDSASARDSQDPSKRIRQLEKKLAKARQDLAAYQELVKSRFKESALARELADDHEGSTAPQSREEPARDDDTGYFFAYEHNDIHAIMIQDKVRTSTYAAFILQSPSLFRDAVVLDVGCGTGILSLFAARAGAKHVIAVDASSVADKARQIVRENGYEHIITVIKGKIEDITLPDGIEHVDVIISEWMGYALLYESMLDSVLVARDRFLRPPQDLAEFSSPTPVIAEEPDAMDFPSPRVDRAKGGVMAPSQTRMVLGMTTAGDAWKERIEFWDDVYGFDMSAMASEVYDDAIVDEISEDSMLTDTEVIKDFHLRDVTRSQLSFSTPFKLRATTPRKKLARAFVLYFDAFFTVTGDPVPPETKAHAVKEGEILLVEVWRVGATPARCPSPTPFTSPSTPTAEYGSDVGVVGRRSSSVSRRDTIDAAAARKEKMRRSGSHRRRRSESERDGIKSFTTGPQSVQTHWKQTLFLLREPMTLEEGSVVTGTFYCRKSDENSRDLDVEIHYRVQQPGEQNAPPGEVVVQTFRVQ